MEIDPSIKELFARERLSKFLERFFSEETITKKIRELPKDRFRNMPDDELHRYFTEMFMLSPLELLEDQSYTDEYREASIHDEHRPTQVVPRAGPHAGLTFSLFIPYIGLRELWFMKPGGQTESHVFARINESENAGNGTLELSLTHRADLPPEKILEQRELFLSPIRAVLRTQAAEIQSVMSEVPQRVTTAVAERRKLHNVAAQLQQVLAIPIRKREGIPNPFPVPLARRIAPPAPGNPTPAYGISREDYEYIIQVLRHVGGTFERTPRTYRVHNEEELRDIVVANLNGHLILKSAMSEAFSVRGKTDILIEYEGRAAFIAECKVWRGPKQLKEAVGQLLRYTTWQDCKVAVVVFNKHVRAFHRILATMPRVVRTAFRVKRQDKVSRQNEWRFKITSPRHADAQVIVHVFAFNIFSAE